MFDLNGILYKTAIAVNGSIVLRKAGRRAAPGQMALDFASPQVGATKQGKTGTLKLNEHHRWAKADESAPQKGSLAVVPKSAPVNQNAQVSVQTKPAKAQSIRGMKNFDRYFTPDLMQRVQQALEGRVLPSLDELNQLRQDVTKAGIDAYQAGDYNTSLRIDDKVSTPLLRLEFKIKQMEKGDRSPNHFDNDPRAIPQENLKAGLEAVGRAGGTIGHRDNMLYGKMPGQSEYQKIGTVAMSDVVDLMDSLQTPPKLDPDFKRVYDT